MTGRGPGVRFDIRISAPSKNAIQTTHSSRSEIKLLLGGTMIIIDSPFAEHPVWPPFRGAGSCCRASLSDAKFSAPWGISRTSFSFCSCSCNFDLQFQNIIKLITSLRPRKKKMGYAQLIIKTSKNTTNSTSCVKWVEQPMHSFISSELQFSGGFTTIHN